MLICSKIRYRLLFQKPRINYLNKNSKRSYHYESGTNWQRINFPNRDIERYTFSFISNNVKYYLLGIVPFHQHSEVLVKEFVKTMKPRNPTVLLDIIPYDPLDQDEERIPEPNFFESFSKSYGFNYIKSLSPHIDNYGRPNALKLADSLFSEDNLKIIRCGRKPSLIAARHFNNAGILERRNILKNLIAISEDDAKNITEINEESLSNVPYNELFLNNPFSSLNSLTTLIVAENALNFSHHLKQVSDTNIVAGIVDYKAIDMIMYTWDKEISYDGDFNKLETPSLHSKIFVMEFLADLASILNKRTDKSSKKE